MNKPVIGYVRVSKDEQVRDGVSLDAQEAKIRSWAALHEQEIITICRDEGIGGKLVTNRPGLIEALRLAGEHKAALVAYSLSRLSRSVRDAIDISERLAAAGADLVSINERIDTTSPGGRLFFTIMAGLAQFERETIQERTQMALDYKRTKGEALGNVPYGWSKERIGDRVAVLTPHIGEMQTVELLLTHPLALSGSWAGLARMLNGAMFRNRDGQPWNRGSLHRIVHFYRSPNGEALLRRYRDVGGSGVCIGNQQLLTTGAATAAEGVAI